MGLEIFKYLPDMDLSSFLEDPQRLTDSLLDELAHSTFRKVVGPNRHIKIGTTDSGKEIKVFAKQSDGLLKPTMGLSAIKGLDHYLFLKSHPRDHYPDRLINLGGNLEADHFHAQVSLLRHLDGVNSKSDFYADRRQAAQIYWQWMAEFCQEIGVNLLISGNISAMARIRDTLPESMVIEDSQTQKGKPALLWRNPEGAFSHNVNIVGAEYLVLGELADLVHQILFPRQLKPDNAPQTYTYEQKHEELMQMVARDIHRAKRIVERIAVFGVGLSEDGKVYEPFEWLKLFPEATLDAYDRNRDSLDVLAQSDLGGAGRIIGHQRDFVTSSPLIIPGQKYDIISCLYVLEYLPANYRTLLTIILLSHLKEQGSLYFEDQDGKFLPRMSESVLNALGVKVGRWWRHLPSHGWGAQKQYVRLQKVRSSGVLDRLAQRVSKSRAESGVPPSVRGIEHLSKVSNDDPKASFDGSMSLGGSPNFQVYSGIEIQQEKAEFVVGNAEVFTDGSAQYDLDVDRLPLQLPNNMPEDWESTLYDTISISEEAGFTEVANYLELADGKEVNALFTNQTELYRNLIEAGYAGIASQLSQSEVALTQEQIIQLNAALFANAPEEVVALIETILPADSMSPVGPSTTVFGTTSHSVIRSTSVLKIVR